MPCRKCKCICFTLRHWCLLSLCVLYVALIHESSLPLAKQVWILQEQQFRAAQLDQSPPNMPESSGQESWPDRSAGYSNRQKYSGGQSFYQERSDPNQASQDRYQGDSVDSARQQQWQPKTQPSTSPPKQQGRAQKSWGSDIDIGSLDDWDST